MAIPDLKFLSENRKSFMVFRFFGLLPSKFDQTSWRTCLIMFFSRLLWFLWHVLGASLAIWNWYVFTYVYQQETSPSDVLHYHYDVSITIFNTTQKSKCSDVEIQPASDNMPKTREITIEDQHKYADLFINISGLIFILMIIGPLQSNVIKRNIDLFPRILKNIKKLEAIQLPKQETKKCSEEEEERYLLHNVDSDSIDEKDNEEDNIDVVEKGNCCKNCYAQNLLPRISVGISMTIFLVCFCATVYVMHDLGDLMDEWKLVLMVFFLPLPVLTTWFCIVLINQLSTLYDELYDLKPEAFTDSKEMMRISDYITILQRTVEILRDEIFEYTIGINFVLFVTIGTVSMFEILQGFQETKNGNNESEFAEIDYLIPLFISILCIYKICSACDNLMSNVHERLLLRMKEILSKHLFVTKIFEGNPHKKIKHLYENLKDWQPQVYIYGGWKLDFQLFVGVMVFMFSYAKLFYDM